MLAAVTITFSAIRNKYIYRDNRDITFEVGWFRNLCKYLLVKWNDCPLTFLYYLLTYIMKSKSKLYSICLIYNTLVLKSVNITILFLSIHIWQKMLKSLPVWRCLNCCTKTQFFHITPFFLWHTPLMAKVISYNIIICILHFILYTYSIQDH